MLVLKVNMVWEKKLKFIYYRYVIMNVGVLRKCRLKKKKIWGMYLIKYEVKVSFVILNFILLCLINIFLYYV